MRTRYPLRLSDNGWWAAHAPSGAAPPGTSLVPAALLAAAARRGGGTRALAGLSSLERAALEVFRKHTSGAAFNPATSGAEWWLRVKPVAGQGIRGGAGGGRWGSGDIEAGASVEGGDGSPWCPQLGTIALFEGLARVEPMEFHTDKNEALVASRRMHVAPHLSTVTYLTGAGGPTLVLPFAYCTPRRAAACALLPLTRFFLTTIALI